MDFKYNKEISAQAEQASLKQIYDAILAGYSVEPRYLKSLKNALQTKIQIFRSFNDIEAQKSLMKQLKNISEYESRGKPSELFKQAQAYEALAKRFEESGQEAPRKDAIAKSEYLMMQWRNSSQVAKFNRMD